MSAIFRKSKNMSHRRKLVIAVGIVMLVFTGIWIATMHIAPENDVEKYKKALIAKGEKLEISEVLPPPVPPKQNGADIVKEAAGLIVGIPELEEFGTNVPPAMRQIAPGKAVVCFEQPDVRGDDFTNSWSNVLAVAETNHPGAEVLKQVLDYPALDFHLDYTNGLEMDTTRLDSVYKCTQLLLAAAICDLHEGKAASAATNICVLLALVNGEQSERMDSMETRIQACYAAVAANWELLQSSNVNAADLAMLQKNWARLEFFNAAENELLMDRAIGERTIQKARNSDEYLNQWANIPPRVTPIPPPGSSATWSEDLDGLWYMTKVAYSKSMWRASWSYSDELQMLQNDQLTLETMRTIETNGFFNPDYTNLLNQLSSGSTNVPNGWLAKLGIPDLHEVFSENSQFGATIIEQAVLSEVAKRMVIAAIALKRYQLKYGKYPPNLDSLVPEFVRAVPLDAADGKPLHYRQNGDGTFLLYSVGFNGVDNGGISSNEPDEDWLGGDLDWVWPQPATAEEIEYFYAHPPP